MASWLKFVNKHWLIATFFASVATFAQPKIDLTEGTLFISGGFAFNYSMMNFTDSSHNFGLKSEIGGGYFIIDRLAIGLSVPAEVNFAKTSTGDIGVKVSSTYFFDTDSTVFPYVGGNITPGYHLTQRSFQLSAGIDAGVLVSLSESVALDFGIKPEIYFKLFDAQNWKIKVPAGFFGVRAVF